MNNKQLFTYEDMQKNRELGYNKGYNMAIKDIVSGFVCVAFIVLVVMVLI